MTLFNALRADNEYTKIAKLVGMVKLHANKVRTALKYTRKIFNF